MRALAIPVVLAALTGTASAGDLRIDLGFRTDSGLRIGLGLRSARRGHVCAPRRVWVPGHYETVRHRVHVPASTTRVYEPPVYEWRVDACGRRVRVCVRPGGYRIVHEPARWEWRSEQVWRSGYHEVVYDCDCHGHRRSHAAPVRPSERHRAHGRHDHRGHDRRAHDRRGHRDDDRRVHDRRGQRDDDRRGRRDRDRDDDDGRRGRRR